MSLDTDEAEHSIEMHLPYVAKVMAPKKDQYTVVPVLVGAISAEKEARYGQIFAKYLADPTNLFVISSDFCHWGDRFHYTFYDETKGEIHQSIKALDFAVNRTTEHLISRKITIFQNNPGKTREYLLHCVFTNYFERQFHKIFVTSQSCNFPNFQNQMFVLQFSPLIISQNLRQIDKLSDFQSTVKLRCFPQFEF